MKIQVTQGRFSYEATVKYDANVHRFSASTQLWFSSVERFEGIGGTIPGALEDLAKTIHAIELSEVIEL